MPFRAGITGSRNSSSSSVDQSPRSRSPPRHHQQRHHLEDRQTLPQQRRHSKPHQSQNHFGVDLKDGPWLFRAAQVDRSWLQLVDRAINTRTKSWLPAIGAKSCFGSLRGDKFFFTTVVLVTISHILQQPPSRVRAQLRVKPVTLF